MFRFASPLAFLLLVPVGVAAWLVYRRRVREGLLFSAAFRVQAAKKTWRTVVSLLLPVLYIAGLVFGVVALARPQTVFSRSTRHADVIAIMMVVDISGSMEALDFTQGRVTLSNYRTRLDVVKETFADFIAKRPEDLVGLVTFGGFASTRSPLTTDHNALLHILKGVEIPDRAHASQEEFATAIGDGLATACARLEKAEPGSKIVVLLSDGASNAGIIEPPEAADAAKKLGIKVYTIGVMSPRGHAMMLVPDRFGRKRIVNAQLDMDEGTLKRIAATTDGKYFNVQDPDGLKEALDDIDELEKTEVEREMYHQYNELFSWALVPGMLLVLLGTVLNMMVAKRIV